MGRGTGTALIVIGLALAAVGVLAQLGALSWLGRLPGDLRFERGGMRVHVPLASMLLVSVVLTVVVNLLLRWWR